MKKIVVFSFIIFLISACNNKSDQPGTDDDTATENLFSWQATVNDSSGRLEMKRIETTGPDSLRPEAVITFINSLNNNIRIELAKISRDTIYLKIFDATYLTQQMGSTGSLLYISEVVYNLTEIKGIKYVNVDFKEGDHASPGILSRESFKDE